MLHFTPGPRFKPLRTESLDHNDIAFKPRSRTTKEWTRGTFNAVRSTLKSKDLITREWCLLASAPHKVLSAKGDSGAIILDGEFRPVAMVWGGNDHDLAHGPVNLTYASRLVDVLRDIESRMRWAKGSVSMA